MKTVERIVFLGFIKNWDGEPLIKQEFKSPEGCWLGLGYYIPGGETIFECECVAMEAVRGNEKRFLVNPRYFSSGAVFPSGGLVSTVDASKHEYVLPPNACSTVDNEQSIERLKKALSGALSVEDYEAAARLRDDIERLNKE